MILPITNTKSHPKIQGERNSFDLVQKSTNNIFYHSF